jgi:hypothetical protein
MNIDVTPILGMKVHSRRTKDKPCNTCASTDHAERCLGHVIGGVREVYDRYEYLDEKRAAFEALAAIVSTILR